MPKFLLFSLLFLGSLAMGANAQNFEALEAEQPAEAQAPPKSQAKAADCQDDPRLETDLLAIMEAKEPVTPPIRVSPDTFINMDPDLLKVLGGQMIICPNIPVLKNGRPARKVETDFEVIWDNIRKAAIAGDEAKMKTLLTSYRAAPKPTKEIIALLAPIGLEEKTGKKLYTAAGLEYPTKKNGGYFPRLIDFYKVLGGKASDQLPVIAYEGSWTEKDQEKFTEKYKVFLPISPEHYGAGYAHYDILIQLLNGVGCLAEVYK